MTIGLLMPQTANAQDKTPQDTVIVTDSEAVVVDSIAMADSIATEAMLTDDPEADDITRYFDMLAKEWQTKRDNMHEAKIKEIEDAYQEWLSEYAKSEIKQ